jgi:peptidoglycan/xylan/chitin deacetylase (PgdA/CDA1 family)
MVREHRKQNVTQPGACLHVDLDGAADIYRSHGWEYGYADDPVFESGLKNTLRLLAVNGIRATLFTVAGNLDHPRKRELIQEAVRAGHEIASHSVTHRNLLTLSPRDKRLEIADSREKLERSLGVTIHGFRAPGYSLDRECLELLAEYEYEYDSSVFPTEAFARQLQIPVERLTTVHHPILESELIELPLPDYRPWPFPFNPSYSLLFGERYFRWGLERAHRRRRPLTLLFHLIDLADPLPRERLNGAASRLFTLSGMSASCKLDRCQRMLDLARERYDFRATRELLAMALPTRLAAAV